MAPKRHRTELNSDRVDEPNVEMRAKRVTRSSTRLGDGAQLKSHVAEVGPKTKKGRNPKTTTQVPKTTTEENSSTSDVNDNGAQVIIVEHCTQCNRIKKRALEVKAGLEEAAKGVKVLINPEKPRRGCFEIRTDGGEIFLSIQGLKRPFKPLMDLDMTEVVGEIVPKVNVQKDQCQ